MNKIEAVVFDIDGTLLDTSEFIYQAYERVLQKHAFPARTRQEIATPTQIGRKISDCYAFLAPGGNHQAMIDDHNVFQGANVALVRAFEHVGTALESVKHEGWKTGLWTGRYGNVVDSLEAGGLAPDAFDCLVDGSMYKRSKPDPEGLLLTAQTLNVKVNRTVMVGDAGLDIEAGHRGGVIASVGITHGFGTREELIEANTDFIIDSLAELPGVLATINSDESQRS